VAQSLDGPWKRLDAPLFGPDPAAWDNVSFRYIQGSTLTVRFWVCSQLLTERCGSQIDVSNPSPIIHKDGSVIMLYKGRGKTAQHMGLATAPSVVRIYS
jgi:hypothetical protein